MPNLIDLTNQKFGRLTVLKRDFSKNNERVWWQCRCDCGNICVIRGDQLRRGVAQSCGCLKLELTKTLGKANFKDLTNQKFGRLTAIRPIKKSEQSKYYWLCQCDCGNLCEVIGTSLTSNNTQSCGCLKSVGEANIQSILDRAKIKYQKQYKIIIDGHNRFFDYAIFDNNNQLICFIEFDGIQHYGRISGWFTEERKEELIKSDNDKTNYCKGQNIKLIRIPYWERDTITLNTLFSKQYTVVGDNQK